MIKIYLTSLLSIIMSVTYGQLTPVIVDNFNDDKGFFGKDSKPELIVSAGKNLFVYGSHDGLGKSLFSWDGTTVHTVTTNTKNAALSYGVQAVPYGDKLVYALSNVLYVSDGSTDSETILSSDFDISTTKKLNPKTSFQLNGKLYFWAESKKDLLGKELYMTDGTAAGTKILKDFNSTGNGAVASFEIESNLYSSSTVLYKNKAYFLASDKDSVGIYETDGTTAGTVLVKNINKNSYASGSVVYPNVYGGNKALFAGTQLNLDTKETLDFASSFGVQGGSIHYASYREMKGLLYFIVTKSTDPKVDFKTNYELRSTDGTANSMKIISDKIRPFYSTAMASLGTTVHSANGRIFYQEFQMIEKQVKTSQLWASDGTDAGTVLLKDSVKTSSFNGTGEVLYMCNNQAFYTSKDYILASDGTVAKTSIPFVYDKNISFYPYAMSKNCDFYFSFKSVDEVKKGIEPHSIALGAPKPSAIDGTIEVNVQVYPTVSNGDFTIDADANGSYKLFDFSGVLISSGALNAGKNMLSVSGKGVHILVVNTALGQKTFKVILF